MTSVKVMIKNEINEIINVFLFETFECLIQFERKYNEF